MASIPTGSLENLQNIEELNRHVFYFPAIEIKRVVFALSSMGIDVIVTNVLARGCIESGKKITTIVFLCGESFYPDILDGLEKQ